MLSAEKKKQQSARLSENLSRAKASFLVNCIGLNAEQTTSLRKSLKESQGDIQVIRNSLSLRVLAEREKAKSAYADHIVGPSAFVLAFKDPAKTAKVIDGFSKKYGRFQIKSGLLGDRVLDREEVRALAELPSEEVLKARFLGLLSAVPSKFLSVLQAAPASFVRLLQAKQKSSTGGKAPS